MLMFLLLHLSKQLLSCDMVSYLFLYTVVLIYGILVLRCSDTKERGQFLSHVVTYCKTNKQKPHKLETSSKHLKKIKIQ